MIAVVLDRLVHDVVSGIDSAVMRYNQISGRWLQVVAANVITKVFQGRVVVKIIWTTAREACMLSWGPADQWKRTPTDETLAMLKNLDWPRKWRVDPSPAPCKIPLLEEVLVMHAKTPRDNPGKFTRADRLSAKQRPYHRKRTRQKYPSLC